MATRSECRQPRGWFGGSLDLSSQEIVMASIHKEIPLAAHPDAVWDVVRDIGAVHTRFAPGFVVDLTMEVGARLVTFANGLVAREVIVDVDEGERRLAYSVRSERLAHHNASFQVFAEGAGSRLVWIADVLPDSAAASVGAMMDEGLKAASTALSPGQIRERR
jgi:carbon monoxide dehydrogenase subunit G